MSERARSLAPRLLLAGVLLAWLWRAPLWLEAVSLARTMPVDEPFFPARFRSALLLAVALAVPPLVGIVALFVARARQLAFVACALSALLLLVQQASYNDASFVTAFWSALYGTWLTEALRAPNARTHVIASRLARGVVALMFFGGAVGKLTPGYWDGSVFYELCFARSPHFTFVAARALLDDAALHRAALVYSRMVVCIEWLLAILPLWPSRLALQLAPLALIGMVLGNDVQMLSALGPLLGVCASARVLERAAGAEVTVRS